jgi:hypothetical protein
MMVTEKVSGRRKLVKSSIAEDKILHDYAIVAAGTAASRADRLEARTRRWGFRRNKDARIVTNEFGTWAPLFFYQLVAAFVASKSNFDLWSRGDGARLMANVILTLSCFVQCSGNHPGTHILAYDLFSAIWEFHDAESPAVRQAVMVGVATCIMFISPDDLIKIVLDKNDLPSFLIDAAIVDSNGDDQCKQLAVSVLARIKEFSEQLVCLT